MANFGPLMADDLLASLGHPSKFQRVSRLAFITAVMSRSGGQPNFARCLAICWAGRLYVHFRRLLPTVGILPDAKFTLRPTLAFSLAALLHSTPPASMSQALIAACYKEWNYGTFTEGATYIWLGSHHVGHRPTF